MRLERILVPLVLILTVTVPLASARGDEPLVSRGTGEFKLGGETSRIVSLTLKPRRNESRFDILVELRNKTTLEFVGNYKGQGHHRDVIIKRGLGHETLDGRGEVVINDNTGKIRIFDIHGEVDGKHYTVKFERDKIEDEADNAFSFSDAATGSGRLDLGDDKHRVLIMRVHLSRNGDLAIHAEGSDLEDTAWAGRWRGDGPEFHVELRRSGSHRVHAEGKLVLSKNLRHFKMIEINGKEDGEFFRLYFEAD
jgi:hypothetical protein